MKRNLAQPALALATDDRELRVKVVAELCKTERNFILKKDETTVQLQQVKVEKDSAIDFAKAVSDMVEQVKK